MSEELEQFKNKFSKLVEDEKYSELLAISETKLEELNKTAPDDKEFLAYIYFAIGCAKYHLGKYQDAIEDLDKAIELDPKLKNAYYGRGDVKYALGNFQDAIEDYNKTIELKPDYLDAYNNRGVAKANLDNFQEAIEDYNKVIELMPDCAIVYLLRGATNLDLHNYIKAIKDFWLFLIVKIGFKRQHKH